MNLLKVATTIGAMLAITACTPAPTIFDDDPRQWGAVHQQRIDSLPLLGRNGVCDYARRQANANGLSNAQAMLIAELRRRGLTSRDIEIINSGRHIYGTGMSFNGLSCALRFQPKTNKAFYSGVGHRWQAVTGEGYVYLEGDGTPEGMRIRSWN
jgi:hypothetical protein